MKILVKSEGYRIFLPVPTWCFTSRFMVRLWLRTMRRSQKYATLPEAAGFVFWNLSDEKVYRFCDELRRIKKLHKTWPLVEVESADGDRVEIIL